MFNKYIFLLVCSHVLHFILFTSVYPHYSTNLVDIYNYSNLMSGNARLKGVVECMLDYKCYTDIDDLNYFTKQTGLIPNEKNLLKIQFKLSTGYNLMLYTIFGTVSCIIISVVYYLYRYFDTPNGRKIVAALTRY